MTAPPNFIEIPPSKVAVETDMERHEERFWENRRDRKLRDYDDFLVDQEDAEMVYFASIDRSYYELM